MALRARIPFARIALLAMLLVTLLAQLAVNGYLKPLRPAIEEMPFPPTSRTLKAFALGDDQFLFRAQVAWLQDVGDGGGRMRPLNQYDYRRVVDWLRVTDSLDPGSNAVFALGSSYFGAITDPVGAPPRLKLLTEYFKEAGRADLEHRWSWLVWAAIKIQHNVGDPALARQTAEEMLGLAPEVGQTSYYWLPLLAAPLYWAAGDKELADFLDRREDLVALRLRAFKELNGRLYGSGLPPR